MDDTDTDTDDTHGRAARTGVTGGGSHHLMLIGGGWVGGASGESFDVLDPATGGFVASVPRGAAADVDAAVAAARAAFAGWRRTAPEQRSRALIAVADAIEAEAEEIATTVARETGNALRTQSRPEVGLAASFVRYFAGTAAELKGTTTPVGGDLLNYTVREPLGVVAAVIPWNTPVALAALKISMALCTGNTIVLKTAEDAPLAALHVAEIFQRHVPAGVVNALTGFGPDCGAALTNHAGVDKLTFTGSTAVGKDVMRAAAERVTPVSLELGGKNPAIVFPDSDTVDVARGVMAGMRFGRQGQSCTAGSRLFVHEDVFESFVRKLVGLGGALRVGDPFDASTDMGSLINARQYERVRRFVIEAVGDGATLRLGREPEAADGTKGYFMSPVILTDVDPSWRVAREEVFGPVLVVIPWREWDDVVAMANDSHYGLAAYVWCRDTGLALRTAHAIDSGWVQVNRGLGQLAGMTYGGFKQSGIGAECSSEAAIAAYTRSKTVTVGL
ncbi:aldehyde dehydrogenase family protein [Actinomadura madurae]|uniref:aldehyde dehydrogenase family protein n=1 Tax=Actinomadura madurae TaxID=1993 RepID=UPI002026625A|nr:aldehyde dehydrogenase family protein [Actinomadura madurae]URN09704.1 aldehyde dehydrogenase family protein [Actinomadura madurae]